MARRRTLSLRGEKASVDPLKPVAVWREFENDAKQRLASVTTVLLTGAECRFACSMCDLWRHTLDVATPEGALPHQIDEALMQVPDSDWIKLYNASNFFDPYAVPEKDLHRIARQCDGFERVIVENHPRLLRPSIDLFSQSLRGRLEVAMGLETIYLPSLELLEKESTLEDFETACQYYRDRMIDIRVFLMLQPPGTPLESSVTWAIASTEYAVRLGARHVSIIPTRGGNGQMESFADEGIFQPPNAWQMESSLEQLLRKNLSCVITLDLWDWSRVPGTCETCRIVRLERLRQMNLEQRWIPGSEIDCPCARLRETT